MKRISILLFALVICCWAVPKPMESIENYNVLLLHGAYGHTDADGVLQGDLRRIRRYNLLILQVNI